MTTVSRARCGAVWIVALFLATLVGAQDGRVALATRIKKLVDGATSQKLQIGVAYGEPGAAPAFLDGELGGMVPASNEKVLTSIAAVTRLGLKHEFATRFVAHGRIANGALAGALRVIGDGDPSFGIRDHGETLAGFRIVAERLRGLGILRIDGDLLVDDSAFDLDFTGPDWPKGLPTTSYLAGASALSVDEGLTRVVITPSKDGTSPRVTAIPDVGTIKFGQVNVRTVSKRQDAGMTFDRPLTSNELTVKGAIFGTAPQIHEIAVHDPTLHFGRCLLLALKQEGIAVSGTVRRPKPEERGPGNELLTIATPLDRVLPAMLKESQNHRAEMIFKHLGAVTGSGGTYAGGSQAVRASLAALGVNLDKCSIMDGSGLSRSNRVTARAAWEALSAVARRPEFGAYRDLLAEPGEDGTLKRRLPSLKNKMAGKTGTLNNVKTLSGYVMNRDGKWIVFVVFCNGADAESKGGNLQDSIVEAIAAASGA